jgi:hypothetical protein
MSDKQQKRGLSETFIQDLLDGALAPLLKRVKNDTTLDMEIRQEYINIYYRGGNVLRVSKDSKRPGYSAFFDLKYGPAIKSMLPDEHISSADDAERWLGQIPLMKDAMDLWFGDNPKAERASQQMVVYENNVSPWAGGTDYFIVDIEYDNHIGARFDLIALRWDSDATARKLQGQYLPKLTAIEMKTGDGALSGDSGLLEHYRQWEGFFADGSQLDAFKLEMLGIFEQKRKLGLIPALKNNPNRVLGVAPDVDVIFLIANHDPASGKLIAAVDEIREKQNTKPPPFNIRFAAASFMGFGLYSPQNILSLDDFGQHLDRIANKTA